MKLDKHQIDGYNAILNTLKNNNKTLFKMYCGTGKTRTMFYYVLKNYLFTHCFSFQKIV